MLGPECCFRFEDLFFAAEDRRWTLEEEAMFKSLTQDERNAWVAMLVKKAPQFTTQDRIGTDGLVYRAFWID